MAIQTAAGTSLAIVAGTPANYDNASFEQLSYENVGEIVSISEHGATYATVTHNPLDTRRTAKLKGSVNDGTITLALAMDLNDAGQTVLREGNDGSEVDTVHSVRITYQNGDVSYFTALVMSYTRNPGGSDQVVGANCTLEVTNKVLDIAA